MKSVSLWSCVSLYSSERKINRFVHDQDGTSGHFGFMLRAGEFGRGAARAGPSRTVDAEDPVGEQRARVQLTEYGQ